MSRQELQHAHSDEIIEKIAEKPVEQKDIAPELEAVFNKLNPKDRAQAIKVVKATIKKQEAFKGPIPHPELLQGYENIKEGFAERIVRMAEKEQEHRFERENIQLECDKTIIKATASESKRGQNYALIIAVLFLLGAIVLALFGHDTVASILGGGTLAAIVTVFITGRRNGTKKDQDHD